MRAILRHAVWTLVAIVGSLAPAQAGDPPKSYPPQSFPPQSCPPQSDIEQRVHALLKRESSTTGPAQAAAIRELAGLYPKLANSPQLEPSERTALRGLVRNRLDRIAQRLSRRLAKVDKKMTAGRPAAKTASAGRGNSTAASATAATVTAHPATIAAADHRAISVGAAAVRTPAPLAQRLGAMAGPLPAHSVPSGSADQLSDLSELIQHVVAADRWQEPAVLNPAVLAQRRAAAAPAAGGAGNGLAGFGGAPQQPADFGQDLLELIQHTIAPDTWDVNGGNGTIFYYEPLRAMVIRQTDEVHDDLGNLLRGLRD